jgi:hypothetical protein
VAIGGHFGVVCVGRAGEGILNMSTQSGLAEAGPAPPWSAARIELWPIERLVPYANNARLHSAGRLFPCLRMPAPDNRVGEIGVLFQ